MPTIEGLPIVAIPLEIGIVIVPMAGEYEDIMVFTPFAKTVQRQ
jgi:hypothetical protein